MMTESQNKLKIKDTVTSEVFSFILTVVVITSAFIGVFLYAFPYPLGVFLAASVGIVTVATALIGIALTKKGHFERDEELYKQTDTPTIDQPES